MSFFNFFLSFIKVEFIYIKVIFQVDKGQIQLWLNNINLIIWLIIAKTYNKATQVLLLFLILQQQLTNQHMSSFTYTINHKPESTKTTRNQPFNYSLPMTYIHNAMSYALAVSLNKFYAKVRQGQTAVRKHEFERKQCIIVQEGYAAPTQQQKIDIIKLSQLSKSTFKQQSKELSKTYGMTVHDSKEILDGSSSIDRHQFRKVYKKHQKSNKNNKYTERTEDNSCNEEGKSNEDMRWGFNIAQIDLQNKAKIPMNNICSEELSHRRQALMLRKINDWSIRPKKQRARRQIRGLMN